MDPSKLRWSLPVTLLVDSEKVWLVASEDVRYSLAADRPEELACFLRNFDGPREAMDGLLREATSAQKAEWQQITAQLYSERILIERAPYEIPYQSRPDFVILGENRLAEEIRKGEVLEPGEQSIRLFCQDDLNYGESLDFNAQALKEGFSWMWLTVGPSERAYLGPLMRPDTGPCLDCLLHHFRLLSPEPELHDTLCLNPEENFAAAPFPLEGLSVMASLSRWKISLINGPPNPALYSLHVLECSSLTVDAHPVFLNPECPSCTR